MRSSHVDVFIRDKSEGIDRVGSPGTLILCRQIILELRKEEDYTIPVWIILGSSLGGLLLLALLVLALWKVYVYTHTLHFCRKGI